MFDQVKTSARRDSGMPIMSQISSSGSGAAISVTRSNSPPCSAAVARARASTSSAIRSTSSTSPVIRFGVKAPAAIRRILVWRGASMLISEPKNSCASAGMSRIETAPRPEQNRSGLRLTSSTSACRVTTRKPGPGSNPGNSGSGYIGKSPRARRAAKAA